MTDIAASLGLAALDEFSETLSFRQKLYATYCDRIKHIDRLHIVRDSDSRKEHAAWLFTVLVDERRTDLQMKLRSNGIESGQTHYRNDRYSIFADTGFYPAMDEIDDKYLVLPLHTKMRVDDVNKICDVIESGW
jgi:dTDP-4-amino-4,6-dideoxygalactose transaminase